MWEFDDRCDRKMKCYLILMKRICIHSADLYDKVASVYAGL